MHLGRNLDGRRHAENVVKQGVGRLSFLYRKAAFLDFSTRKLLTSALIQPYLDYCTSSWYEGVPKYLKSKLDVLQRRMVRFIFSKDQMYHIGTKELKSLSWLTVPDRVKFFRLLHVFKIRAGLAPHYLTLHFRPISDVHTHSTRGCLYDFHVSKEISMAPTSFAYIAITQWNGLPECLKGIQSLFVFKTKLKSFLLEQY